MIRRATVGLTRTLFRVQPGEGERVLLMLAFSLLAVGGIVITGQLIGRSLFLSRLPASAIPLKFVMPPLVLVGAVALFTRLARRMRHDRLVVLTFGTILAGVIGMRLLLGSPLGGTLSFLLALFIFFEIAGSLTMILFWILAGDLFNAREAKRLFGIIAGGSALSNIAFGAFLGRMAATSPPESLFWVIVVSVLLSLAIVVHLVRRYPSASAEEATQPARDTTQPELGWIQSLREVVRSPLTMAIGSIVVVVALVSGIADYQLDLAIKEHYADDGQGMVRLLALLRLGSGIVAFVLQLLLAGFLMQRFGILTVLMLLPLAMAGGATGILLTGGALWAVMIPRGADIALKYTIHDSAFNMLYLPLPPALRARTKAVVDGMLKPVLVGMLGLAFLAVGRIEGVSLLYWSPPMLLLIVLWIVLLVRASRCYIDALSHSLVMRRLDLQSASFDLTDETSARVLGAALEATDGLRILHTLALLRLSEADWSERVLSLLGHQNPEVRIAAAEYLGDRGNAEVADRVGSLLQDAEPTVRRASVEAYGALLGTGSVTAIVDHLQDPDRAVRGTAIVTLIRRGGLAGFLHAGRPLNELLESEDSLERVQGATLLGELAVQSFYEPLAELLEDPAPEVVLAAVRASTRVAAPELIPRLRATLRDSRLRRDAAQAIVACAGTERKTLEALIDDPGVPAAVRADLAAALAGCGAGATQELIRRLDHPEPAVRAAVFRALQSMREAGDLPAIDRATLDSTLENELRVAFERLVLVHDLRDTAGTESLLTEALAQHVHDDEDRVLSLLPLLYPNLPIAPLREALRHPHERVRANAVELIDNVVDTSKPLLIPYVGGNDTQKLAAARSILQLGSETAEQRLRALVGETDPWLRACALQMLGEAPGEGSKSLIATVEQALDSTDEIVRLTALSTLDRLGRPRPEDKESPMALAPLEKVLFLKQVPLFHEITGEEIAAILPLAQEVTFERGTEIIRQNDSGDALYIIVEGEVGIAIDGRPTDGTIGSRAVIGELSILTGDPRAATCTAMTEVLALRIQREPFWELMRERPEVTIGVVRILLGYLAKDKGVRLSYHTAGRSARAGAGRERIMAYRGSKVFRLCLSAIVLAATLTTGCVSSRQISMRAVDYNVAAENARSEMLLLNVLRARDRKPLIFTGLTRISGSIRSQVGIGASAQTGPDASNVQNLAPNTSFSDAPSFDVAVLDSQEFTRGIMTPIAFKLIEYLWDQGFPREMLMLLAFERIDVECPASGGEVRSLYNDPTEPTWDDFRVFIDALDFDGQWQIDDHLVDRIGPPLDEAAVKSLGTLLSVAGSHLNLRRVEAEATDQDQRLWQLERPSVGLRLEVPGVDPCGLGTSSTYRLYESKSKFRRANEVAANELKARVVVRSPQSVLFYLGEQSREGREVLLRKRPSKTNFERRLFAIESSSRCGKAHVKVEYGGVGEVIPNGSGPCHPGRSMQALSLAAQMLSLQQSSRDLPVGGTVRVIGQ